MMIFTENEAVPAGKISHMKVCEVYTNMGRRPAWLEIHIDGEDWLIEYPKQGQEPSGGWPRVEVLRKMMWLIGEWMVGKPGAGDDMESIEAFHMAAEEGK